MNLNFVVIFDVLTDVYDIFISKQVEGDSFVGIMSQREGIVRFCKQFNNVNNIKFWVQKSGTIGQLIYSVKLHHVATYWEKFFAAC